jgi:hypothetical protein
MPCPDDPGRPSGISPYRFLCVGFSSTYLIAACVSCPISGLCQTSGRCGLPYGLHGSLCTLQTFRSVVLRLSSSRSATLGTGGWLDLTRQGLAPCKKRQACLGAHVVGLQRGRQASAGSPRVIRLSQIIVYYVTVPWTTLRRGYTRFRRPTTLVGLVARVWFVRAPSCPRL